MSWKIESVLITALLDTEKGPTDVRMLVDPQYLVIVTRHLV